MRMSVDAIRTGTLVGGTWGSVIGDALGVPYEFKFRGSFECRDMTGYGTHGQREGTWSDDSSMFLATCKSLKENDMRVDTEDMRARFIGWMDYAAYTPHGEVFDIGGTTAAALSTGVPGSDKRSNGNGSLMRILPLAFTDCTDDEIRAVSGITHAHHISKEACVIYVDLIRKYLGQFDDGDARPDAGRDVCSDAKATKSLADVIREIPKMDPPFDRLCMLDELEEADIESTGYVVHTLEAALWCILQADKEPDDGGRYARCLLRAVNLGDDTDTTAAVAGGLAGIIYPIDGIPQYWIDRIKAKELIWECLPEA